MTTDATPELWPPTDALRKLLQFPEGNEPSFSDGEDGYLEVTYKFHHNQLLLVERYPFKDIGPKGWYWSCYNECVILGHVPDKQCLVISQKAGRIEIPRESILKVDVHYNTRPVNNG